MPYLPGPLECPSCRRALNVPVELAGRDVRCPDCGSIFLAPRGTPDPASPPRPHRGQLLLLLGLASLLPCSFTGPFAWVLGDLDLEDIRCGARDPEGEALTSAARVLGMVGTILMLLLFFCGGSLLLALLIRG